MIRLDRTAERRLERILAEVRIEAARDAVRAG